MNEENKALISDGIHFTKEFLRKAQEYAYATTQDIEDVLDTEKDGKVEDVLVSVSDLMFKVHQQLSELIFWLEAAEKDVENL